MASLKHSKPRPRKPVQAQTQPPVDDPPKLKTARVRASHCRPTDKLRAAAAAAALKTGIPAVQCEAVLMAVRQAGVKLVFLDPAKERASVRQRVKTYREKKRTLPLVTAVT